ncbi:hypothetical protein BGZ63DRAFT_408204 [Mariannaea sp. PMI_226]|nr:hypothetical protein BGZ63DRAFT_408204 [Mariannaea sp. PMI_226]
MGSANNYPPPEGGRCSDSSPGRGNAYPPPHPGRRSMAYPMYSDDRSPPPPPPPNPPVSEEERSSQRKRIAVACGRCRKRKIRCSGDKGNGTPCTNCRNAGYHPCQYLRNKVSSQEARMKQNTFDYCLEASRQYHARNSASAALLSASASALSIQDRSPSATPVQPAQPVQAIQTVQTVQPTASGQQVSQYPDGLPALQANEALAYRHNSASFAYNARPFDPVAVWSSGVPIDQNTTVYSLYNPEYDHELSLPYRPGSNNRNRNTGLTPSTRDVGTCVSPGQSYATTLVHRSASGNGLQHNSTTLSFQGSQIHAHAHTHAQARSHAHANAAAGTTPSGAMTAGSERTFPSPHRDTSVAPVSTTNLGSSAYRNGPSTPSGSYEKQAAASSSQSPQTPSSGTATGPATPASEASSSCYTSYQPSASMPSSVPAFTPMTLASQLTRSNDLYGPSSPGVYSSGIASPAMDSFGGASPGPNMTYRYTDTTIPDEDTPAAVPVLTKFEHRSSPSAEASLGLANTHHRQQDQGQHHRQTFVARNQGQHASYIMQRDEDASGNESTSADGERKPVVLHT